MNNWGECIMIVGRDNLLKLFPDFADDVQENGIDLRVGEIFIIEDDYPNRILSCVEDEKILPNLDKLEIQYLDDKPVYVLEPMKYYFVKVGKDIHIPDGYTQTYAIRSTFARCGLLLISAIGDNDFNGRLMMGLYNTNRHVSIVVGANERIIQAITYQNDGTASSYNGSYQNNKVYQKKTSLEPKPIK